MKWVSGTEASRVGGHFSGKRPVSPAQGSRRGKWGGAAHGVPAAFCGCPMATLIPATFMGRVVTPGEETTAAGTDTTGGFASAT